MWLLLTVIYTVLYSLLHLEEKIDPLDFRVYVTTALLKTDSNLKHKKPGVKVPRLPQPLNHIGEKHFLERTDDGKKRKCKVYKKNAKKQCGQCNLGFHVQCFEAYHSN